MLSNFRFARSRVRSIVGRRESRMDSILRRCSCPWREKKRTIQIQFTTILCSKTCCLATLYTCFHFVRPGHLTALTQSARKRRRDADGFAVHNTKTISNKNVRFHCFLLTFVKFCCLSGAGCENCKERRCRGVFRDGQEGRRG